MASEKRTVKKSLTVAEAAAIDGLRAEGLDPRELGLVRDRAFARERQRRLDAEATAKRALGEIEKFEAFVQVHDALAEDKGRIVWKRSSAKPTVAEGCAIIQASDWHAEEAVEASTVEGVNRFDATVCQRRVERMAERIALLLGWCRELGRVDRAILHLGGDLVSGDIHQELRENRHCGVLEACRTVRKLVRDVLLSPLLGSDGVKDLLIIGSMGNHGRMTERKRYATAWQNHYEYALYGDLAEDLEPYKAARLVAHKSPRYMVDVYGFPLRFHHGDTVGYHGGIGGKVIPLKRAIARWNKKRPAYLDFIGHFHEFEPCWGYYIANGALIGLTAYGDAHGFYQEPTQTFSLLDSERGLVLATPIFLEDPIKKETSNGSRLV